MLFSAKSGNYEGFLRMENIFNEMLSKNGRIQKSKKHVAIFLFRKIFFRKSTGKMTIVVIFLKLYFISDSFW